MVIVRVAVVASLLVVFAPRAGAATITVEMGGAGFLCQHSLLAAFCDSSPTPQWIQDDYIGQSIVGSGLGSVRAIALMLRYNDFLPADQTQTYAVQINGVEVGTFVVDGSLGPDVDAFVTDSFAFDPISGPDYDVRFRIVSVSYGSFVGWHQWYHGDPDKPSSFGLSDELPLAEVPEPATLGLVGLGLAALARRRLARR